MNPFNQLPGFAQTPAGLEHVVWRRLPQVLLIGSLVPIVSSAANRLQAALNPLIEHGEKALLLRDHMVVGRVRTHCTAVLCVGLLCFIVRAMKGPAYVADAHPMPDDHRPIQEGAL